MVAAILRLAIGHKRGEGALGNESQRQKLMLPGRSLRRIADKVPAQVHRERVGVVKLDKVLSENALSAGQPLVELEGARFAQGRADVRARERRHRKAPGAVGQTRHRTVGQLPAEDHFID